MGVTLAIFILLFVLGILSFIITAWWQIFRKAGYSGAFGLLMVVPLVNLVMLCILAFSPWPIQEKLNVAKGLPTTNSSMPVGAIVGAILVAFFLLVGIIAAITIFRFKTLRSNSKKVSCQSQALTIRSSIETYFNNTEGRYPVSLHETEFLKNLPDKKLPQNTFGKDWELYYNPKNGDLNADDACVIEENVKT